jgi:Fe-S-cluster containining protein
MGDAEHRNTADKPRSSQEFLDQLPPELRAGFLQLFEATREIVRDELADIRAGDAAQRLEGLESLARARHADLEDAVEEAFAASAEGEATRHAVACRKGCSFCCHVNVSATIPDAILVAAKIQSGPGARFAPAIRATAERIAGLDAPSRYRQGIPCPMLEDGACGIHEARPTACRAYLATDAGKCEASLNAARSGQPPLPVESLAYPQQLSAAINGGVLQGCGDAGLQNCAVEMTQAVDLILRDPSVVERWLGGESVFTPYGRG